MCPKSITDVLAATDFDRISWCLLKNHAIKERSIPVPYNIFIILSTNMATKRNYDVPPLMYGPKFCMEFPLEVRNFFSCKFHRSELFGRNTSRLYSE